jgi:hypothetical protein
MLAHPTIKRPVMEWSGDASRDITVVGFKPDAWSAR